MLSRAVTRQAAALRASATGAAAHAPRHRWTHRLV